MFTAARKFSGFFIRHEKRSRDTLVGENIIFHDENVDRLMMTHEYALKIILQVSDTNIIRVLINLESSENSI